MNLTVDPRTYEGRKNLGFISLALILISCLVSIPVHATTVSTPVIKPTDDPKVYIPEYCQITKDPTVCDGDHFRIDKQPTQPIKKIEKIKPRNVPGKKLPKYRHGHRRQR